MWCRRKRRKRSRTAFFLWRSELLEDVLKHLGKAKCTSYNLSKPIQVFKLQNYIEKRKSYVLLCGAERRKRIYMVARTDFIDELS